MFGNPLRLDDSRVPPIIIREVTPRSQYGLVLEERNVVRERQSKFYYSVRLGLPSALPKPQSTTRHQTNTPVWNHLLSSCAEKKKTLSFVEGTGSLPLSKHKVNTYTAGPDRQSYSQNIFNAGGRQRR